jgi:hypothetical protein
VESEAGIPQKLLMPVHELDSVHLQHTVAGLGDDTNAHVHPSGGKPEGALFEPVYEMKTTPLFMDSLSANPANDKESLRVGTRVASEDDAEGSGAHLDGLIDSRRLGSGVEHKRLRFRP